MEDKEVVIEKVGVIWNKTFKNGKEGFKLSINKEIFIAFKNLKKKTDKDPDWVIVKFIDAV